MGLRIQVTEILTARKRNGPSKDKDLPPERRDHQKILEGGGKHQKKGNGNNCAFPRDAEGKKGTYRHKKGADTRDKTSPPVKWSRDNFVKKETQIA